MAKKMVQDVENMWSAKKRCAKYRVFLGSSCGRGKQVAVDDSGETCVMHHAQAPGERDECQGRIDIEAELRKGAACAGEDCNEAIHACDLVEQLDWS